MREGEKGKGLEICEERGEEGGKKQRRREWREEAGEETGRTQIKERPNEENNLVKYRGKNSNKERETRKWP